MNTNDGDPRPWARAGMQWSHCHLPDMPHDCIRAHNFRKKRLSFHDGDRVAHVQALYEWLPEDLQHAPHIDWMRVPQRCDWLSCAYREQTIPKLLSLGLVVGAMLGTIGDAHVKVHLVRLNPLLKKTPQCL